MADEDDELGGGADEAPAEQAGEAPKKKPRRKAPKKETKQAAPDVGSDAVEVLELDGHYDVVLMDRRMLKDWPFNPRHMRPEAAKNLKEGLEEVKLLRPAVVWNKRNEQIVAGHKKLDAIDEMMGTDAYRLRVCVVEMDEDQHAEAAILDNNTQAQGDWDFGLLTAIMKRPGVRRKATGFSIQDVYTMWGATGAAVKAGSDALDLARAMEKAQERQTLLKKASSQRDGPDFYSVLVFESDADRQAAHDLFGWPQTPFQDGVEFIISHRDFLAYRALHPGRPPIERAVGAARFLMEEVAPQRGADPLIIDPESKNVLIGYLQQALAELEK